VQKPLERLDRTRRTGGEREDPDRMLELVHEINQLVEQKARGWCAAYLTSPLETQQKAG